MKKLITITALSLLAFSCSSDDNGSINDFTTEVTNNRNNQVEYLGYESYTAGTYEENTCTYALKYHLRNKTNEEVNVTVKRIGYNVYDNGKLNNDKPNGEKTINITLPANSEGWADEQYTLTGRCNVISAKPKKIIIQ